MCKFMRIFFLFIFVAIFTACGGGGGDDSNVSITIDYQYLQYRTFDTQGTDHFRAFIAFRNNGQAAQPTDILSIDLFDQNGAHLIPATPPQFYSYTYTSAAWNSVNSQFELIAPLSDSGYLLNLSNYAGIASGTFTFAAQPATGYKLVELVFFPGQTSLIPVASGDMNYLWNPDGSLTLSWLAPVDTFDQYRVHFQDDSGNELFYGRVTAGVNQVTLAASLVQEISATGQLAGPSIITWRMQTRSYNNDIGNNNYARSVSDLRYIPWP